VAISLESDRDWGAGFIGSWLCDTLVSLDAFVNCLDNLSTALRENLQHLLSGRDFRFRNLDVIQPDLSDEMYSLFP